VPDSNPPRELLLGAVGLERPAWSGAYYPADLPADWRPGYYANDCDCVLLTPEDWAPAGIDELQDAFADVADGFRCFLQMAQGWDAADAGVLADLDPDRFVLLAGSVDACFSNLACWHDDGRGGWHDPASGMRLVRWDIDIFDLRLLRQRAELLDPGVSALVIDGAGASPGRIGELRTLLELMGRA
jgi:hypothetical protein